MVAVCRNWRSIGLSYFALWRYIYVYVGIESIYPPIDVRTLDPSIKTQFTSYIDMQILNHAPCYHQMKGGTSEP